MNFNFVGVSLIAIGSALGSSGFEWRNSHFVSIRFTMNLENFNPRLEVEGPEGFPILLVPFKRLVLTLSAM